MYAFLLIFLMQVGCSSSNRYQAIEDTRSETRTNVDETIETFLSGKETMFHVGSGVDTDTISEAMHILEKCGMDSIPLNPLPEEYIKFLNKYGCIYGPGFKISNFIPMTKKETIEENVYYIVGVQRGFEYRCEGSIRKTQMKSCWCIASFDQGDEYYINYSSLGKSYIYSIDHTKTSKYFAKDFSEFLQKFFEIYHLEEFNETYQNGIADTDQEEDSVQPEDSDQEEGSDPEEDQSGSF